MRMAAILDTQAFELSNQERTHLCVWEEQVDVKLSTFSGTGTRLREIQWTSNLKDQ